MQGFVDMANENQGRRLSNWRDCRVYAPGLFQVTHRGGSAIAPGQGQWLPLYSAHVPALANIQLHVQAVGRICPQAFETRGRVPGARRVSNGLTALGSPALKCTNA